MRKQTVDSLDVRIQRIDEKQRKDGAVSIKFDTSNGTLGAIYHRVEGARAGVILVSGAGGGFDGPASVYEDLAKRLAEHGLSSLRLDYRFPNSLDDCIVDAIIGVEYLKEEGMEIVGIVGWSFGGAVAITAAALHDNIKAVATVATQSFGTESAKYLQGRPILLLHGADDRTLDPASSRYVYERVSGPKEIKIYDGANHGLDQARDEMLDKLTDFLVDNLGEE